MLRLVTVRRPRAVSTIPWNANFRVNSLFRNAPCPRVPGRDMNMNMLRSYQSSGTDGL